MLANSSMIGLAGCAQVATVAKAQGIPVYACCETYNFSYESQLSPFYNQNESGTKIPFRKQEFLLKLIFLR